MNQGKVRNNMSVQDDSFKPDPLMDAAFHTAINVIMKQKGATADIATEEWERIFKAAHDEVLESFWDEVCDGAGIAADISAGRAEARSRRRRPPMPPRRRGR